MKKKNGVVETHYDNGQLKSRTNYKNGKLEGVWEDWYKNGQLKSRGLFKDGVAVEQENDRNVSEEKLLRLERENLVLKIMILRDKQVAHEITYEESLKQLDRLIEENDKNHTATPINYTHC